MDALTLFDAEPPGPAPSRPDAGRADSEDADSEHADSERADSERADPGRQPVRVRLLVAYHGAGFHGFAPQPGGVRTVAGVLAGALERVARQPPGLALTCAGRTDAGVHAWGQVVHADLLEPPGGLDPVRLQRALNKLLAPEVVVRALDVAPPGFDARHGARWRHYRYTVCNRAVPDPFLAATAWHVTAPLHLPTMRLACDPLLGEHDFSSFCRAPRPAPGAPAASLVRTILDAGWEEVGDGLLRFQIRATSFCHQQVRSLVGFLVDVGLGRRRAGDVVTVLAARDRAAAGPVAPPHGLCLWAVGYPDGLDWPAHLATDQITSS